MITRATRNSILAVFAGAILLASPTAGFAQPKDAKKDSPAKIDGRLIVEDSASLFSADGIKKAKEILAELKDTGAPEMNVVTFKELPESKKKDFEAAKDKETTRTRFFTDWAKAESKGARGVFVLICVSPARIQTLVDKQLRDKGFTAKDETALADLLLAKFRETRKVEKEEEKAALRDKGLILAAEYVRDVYKKIAK
jgi:hypothetical protein